MCRLTILPFTPLLWYSFATSTIIASIGTTTSSYDTNARFQTSFTVSGIITTVAGYKRYLDGSVEDGVAATSKKISSPHDVAFDKDGNLYIAAYRDNKIWKVTTSSGIITTAAGTGVKGYGGDGGQATSAMLRNPTGVTLDTTGNIFIADYLNHRIRKIIMSTGVITTVAGNGNLGYSEDNVSATSASLFGPTDVAVDPSGNMFIADEYNRRIRKVSAATGMITTIAGRGIDYTYGSWGRSASGSAAEYYLYSPTGVTLDTSGNVYIADGSRGVILKITVSSGNISTVAGTHETVGDLLNRGDTDDNILATKARLYGPSKFAFDVAGNMYISEPGKHRIRKVTASTGLITTVAGTGEAESIFYISADLPYNGEGGLATLARVNSPHGAAIDVAGNLYFADKGYDVVRKVTFTGETPSISVTSAPSVKGAPSAPVASTPTLFISTASTVTPGTSISMAPTPSASSSSSSPSSSSIASSPSLSLVVRPSTSISMAPTPDASSSSSSSPSSSSIFSSPSLSSTVRPSISISMAPTPGASSSSSISSSPSSKAPAAPSSTATQSSSATHFAQTLHLTMILLSSLLILY